MLQPEQDLWGQSKNTLQETSTTCQPDGIFTLTPQIRQERIWTSEGRPWVCAREGAQQISRGQISILSPVSFHKRPGYVQGLAVLLYIVYAEDIDPCKDADCRGGAGCSYQFAVLGYVTD